MAFAPYALPDSGTVAIVVRDGVPDEGAFAQLDDASNGALRRAVDAADFKGKAESKLDLPGFAGYDRVLLVGAGDKPVTPRLLQDVGGTVGAFAGGSRAPRVELLWSGNEPDAAAHLATGAQLGAYTFDTYKSRDEDDGAPKAGEGELVIRTAAGEAASDRFQRDWQPLATAVHAARDLVTEPANTIYPETFVERIREAFDGLPNVSFEVLDVADMKRLGMGGLLAVGQGSQRPPRLLVVRYNGGAAGEAPVAFVGKGITFDTGGISIKPSSNLWRMKYDMTGAAVATGTVLALAGRRAPVNAVGVAALAENMPSGTAGRPGDVITTMSGKTFEVMSTDAEGRMVLSDAVYYTQQQYKPKVMVDIATLTGAVVSALGDEYAGLFSRHDDLAEQLIAAGEASGEEVWRLPLHPSYAKDLESPIADLRNGGGGPGAGVGAHFIGEWVDEALPLAHLDIAGMAWRESAGTATSPKGATAFGVRLLDRYVRDQHE
ncbi:MAG: hypothetical protein A2190_04590 [Lysobacterales bacterium RIFOXYA1_FULL_69_10]|nr:MAG: hypothetical protein A2190_04590 [Xanthomonadales bacterium RIFOXYA1_FULL_69_10]